MSAPPRLAPSAAEPSPPSASTPEAAAPTAARERGVPLAPLLVLVVALISSGPIFTSGYWWGAHDARHNVYFLHQFAKAFADGAWWPRWSPDFAFGYGYPFFNIYGPLASFVGLCFHRLGLDLVNAVKAVFALSMIGSGLSMYGFAHRLWGTPAAGLLAAATYLLIPYHLADLYVRAALAESVAMVWMPLLFWVLLEAVTQPTPRTVAATAVVYAALLLSHNGLAIQTSFWVAIFLVVLVLWRFLTWRSTTGAHGWPLRAAWRPLLPSILAPGVGLVLGIGLAAIFFLPWLTEYKYVRVDQWFSGYFSYRDHFVQLWQLFNPAWGFGVSVAGPSDTFPFQLGLVPLLLALFGLGSRLPSEAKRLRTFFWISALIFVFLTLDISAPVWEVLGPILSPAQFPWRLMVFACLALSILAGSLLARPEGAASALGTAPTAGLGAAVALVLVLVAGGAPALRAQIVPPAEGPVGLAGLMRFQQSAGEMTGQSVWVREIPTWSPFAEIWTAGGEVTSRADYGSLPEGVIVVSRRADSDSEVLAYDAPAPFRLGWNIAYYPGWRAYLLDPNDERVVAPLEIVPHGTLGHLRVEVPAGRHAVLVRFENTAPRTLGGGLSALSMLVVLGLLIGPRRLWKRAFPTFS